MRRRRARNLLPALLVPLLAACAASPPPTASVAPNGVVIVTAEGSQLFDGDDQVPPTLDLEVQGQGITPAVVDASLDGRRLSLTSASGGVTAQVPPLVYGSAHTLVVEVLGQPTQRIGFQVVGRTQVSAAAWLSPSSQLVCQVVFEYAPNQAAVAAALPGAALSWTDTTHLALSWGSPPAALTIPAGLPAAFGSVLDGPLTLSLTGLQAGQLRRATVPVAAPAPASLPVTLWTVGTSGSDASVDAHASRAAVLSPTGWAVGSDGTLQGSPDPVTLRAAATAGRPVWPLLANDFGDTTATDQFLNDAGEESALVGAVLAQVQSRHFGGVNLDFENVPGSDEGALTGFVRELAAALHGAGAGLSVDVVPHAPGDQNSASAAYDYAAIAAAADQLVVMTYDEHDAAGDPGPVAGIDWQAAELAGTLPGVPAAKVVVGVPLYARIWSGADVTASAYGAAVAQALGEPDVEYGYDFAAATPELSSDPGGVPTQLWFDDADSLLRKIDAVQGKGFAGIAAWRAGFEDPAFWNVI